VLQTCTEKATLFAEGWAGVKFVQGGIHFAPVLVGTLAAVRRLNQSAPHFRP
jgi:hypothetical protein